jgi:hypothetical protein
MLFRGSFRPRADLPHGLLSALSKRRMPTLRTTGPFRAVGRVPDLSAADERIASELYEGLFHFAGHKASCGAAEVFALTGQPEEWIRVRDELQWLLHFLVRPRILHTQYVACLLGFWRRQSRAGRSLAVEARKLDILTQVLPRLAPLASDSDRSGFVEVLQHQMSRLNRLRPASDMEQCLKACATLRAAACHDTLSAALRPALLQLETALSTALLRDGGPATGRLEDGWWLWDSLDDIVRHPTPEGTSPVLVQARDALSAFFGMFDLGGGHWSRHLGGLTGASTNFHAPPLGHAPESGYTRLQQGPTTAFLSWGAACGANTTEVVHNGLRLLAVYCSHEADGVAEIKAERSLRKGVGEALNIIWQGAHAVRQSTTFLASDGCDMRFEQTAGVVHLILQFDSQARIMMARGGAEATVVMPDGGCWVVKLRGGLLEAGPQAQTLQLAPAEQKGQRLNWAVRKLPGAKSAARRPSSTSLPPELPF